MTTRRGFIAAIAAAFALDPERALWVPGKKLISIPAPRPAFDFEAAWRKSMRHFYWTLIEAVPAIKEELLADLEFVTRPLPAPPREYLLVAKPFRPRRHPVTRTQMDAQPRHECAVQRPVSLRFTPDAPR